jgi:hypothetical protein
MGKWLRDNCLFRWYLKKRYSLKEGYVFVGLQIHGNLYQVSVKLYSEDIGEYTKEKFEKMAQLNPNIQLLKQKLDLDIL